jgi:hypothetical protein
MQRERLEKAQQILIKNYENEKRSTVEELELHVSFYLLIQFGPGKNPELKNSPLNIFHSFNLNLLIRSHLLFSFSHLLFYLSIQPYHLLFLILSHFLNIF